MFVVGLSRLLLGLSSVHGWTETRAVEYDLSVAFDKSRAVKENSHALVVSRSSSIILLIDTPSSVRG